MKRQVTILLLLVVALSSTGQKFIKTETPCTDEILFKTPGKWVNASSNYYINTEGLNFQSSQVKEVSNRLDAVHQIMVKTYPQPMAIDAAWHRTLAYGSFAEQITYGRNSQGALDYTAARKKPVATFGYVCGFFPYGCNRRQQEIRPGYPGETATWFSVFANSLRAAPMDIDENEITIDGYPVCRRMPLIKKLGEFELLGIDESTMPISTGGIIRYVIVHRKGMLPYIPVTRKQYLEKCIPYVTSWWDKSIKAFEETREEEGKNEKLNKLKQDRDEVLKKYRQELEKTSNEGLLDAPAIVQFLWDPFFQNPVIFTDEKNGWSLVIHNPEYMRTDLPKYVPQLFVVSWQWNEWKPEADLAKLIEEKFPFNEVQAMIDK